VRERFKNTHAASLSTAFTFSRRQAAPLAMRGTQKLLYLLPLRVNENANSNILQPYYYRLTNCSITAAAGVRGSCTLPSGIARLQKLQSQIVVGK
jgi:hypothetical protein